MTEFEKEIWIHTRPPSALFIGCILALAPSVAIVSQALWMWMLL